MTLSLTLPTIRADSKLLQKVEILNGDFEQVEKALGGRYNSIISQYASYTPEKLDMVKACKVSKDGNYVSLIVAENGPEILKTFQDSIK